MKIIKKFTFATLAGVGIVLASLLLTSPAVADKSDSDINENHSDNKISIGFYFGANNVGGRFTITGHGDGYGTAEVTGAVPYTDAHGVSRVSITKVLHFADGDVFLATDGELVVSPTIRESSGTWTLTGGTGTYEKVKGEGEYHWLRQVDTGILVGAYSGKLKLRHDHVD